LTSRFPALRLESPPTTTEVAVLTIKLDVVSLTVLLVSAVNIGAILAKTLGA
jgi:hypothetical protein